MRFRRALDRGNGTEALSAASELQFVSLVEALELTLLLVDGDLEKYNRAALRWHVRFVGETRNVDIRESQAVLALLTAIPVNALAAAALAELLSRRRRPPSTRASSRTPMAFPSSPRRYPVRRPHPLRRIRP
jgi:hypothetical protein